jgi:hypothetical protein
MSNRVPKRRRARNQPKGPAVKLDANEPIRTIKGDLAYDILKDELGQPVRGPDGRAIATEQPLTIADIIVEAVMGMGRDEKPSGSDKRKMLRLATKIAQADGYVEIDEDEAKFLRARLEAADLTPLAYGRVMDALDLAAAEAVKEANDDTPTY